MSLPSHAKHQILSPVKYTGLLLVIGSAALAFSFKFLKPTHVRPRALGTVSDQWLFEKRRHSDDQ